MSVENAPHVPEHRGSGRLAAVLFDVDGVVTPTARAHAAAWKQLFDTFLADWTARSGSPQPPFRDEDYRRYIDGKPRRDGVRSFLAARGISLPEGEDGDAPDALTVRALATRKNSLFLDWLSRNGISPYPGTVALIAALRAAGIRCATFSSSRNAARVLESAGVSPMFDVLLDGTDLARLGLPGKPDPALLLATARELGAATESTAIVEDAIAGIEAGVRGRFVQVIGVARDGDINPLLEAGAHLVVGDLAELRLDPANGFVIKTLDGLPSLRTDPALLRQRIGQRRMVVFLDYDGTLTPIVEQHDRAYLGADMRAAVERLARHCPVVVMSGRDLARIRELVDLDSVWYAGSHGFQITGPGASEAEHEIGADFLPSLDLAQKALETALANVAGHAIERKKFSIAVHYRRVREAAIAEVRETVDRVLAAHPDLRLGHGKRVFELRPDIDWGKGQAMLWLLKRLGMDDPGVLPIFVGDDITDEDAFRTLSGRGLGIVVRYDGTRRTAADCAVTDTAEVGWLLDLLTSLASDAAPSRRGEPE